MFYNNKDCYALTLTKNNERSFFTVVGKMEKFYVFFLQLWMHFLNF